MAAKRRAQVDPAPVRRAVIYCRISNDPFGKREGVDRQEKDCRKACAERGWEVVDVVVDNHRSASRYQRRKREGWAKVLAYVADGSADAVLAWVFERSMRQPRELEDLIDRAENGSLLLANLFGEHDLSTSEGRTMARIQCALAAKESDDTSRRTRRAHADRAQAGKKAGQPPFGYRLVGATPLEYVDADGSTRVRNVGGKWVPDARQAKIVRELAQRLLAGESVTGLARDLDRRGVGMANGGKAWTATTVRSVVTNFAVAGLRAHHGEEAATGEWEPILDRDTWEQVRAVFAARRGQGQHAKRVTLLTGKVRCACGAVMVRDSSNGKTVLRCKPTLGRDGCGHNVIGYDEAELAITEMLFTRTDTSDLKPRRGNTKATREDGREVARLLERMDELASMFAAGDISRREWLTARSSIDEQLRVAQARVARSAQERTLPSWVRGKGRLRKSWKGLSMDQQRSVMWAVMDRVNAGYPSKRGEPFNADRLEPIWLV